MENKNDLYERVTAQIVELLDKGEIPWRQPWRAATQAPRNIAGRRYSGINVWTLLATARARGYESPYWLTWRQVKERTGSVRKGEHATPVVFWKFLNVKTDQTDKDGKPEVKRIPLLRYYNVWNSEQCEGITTPALPVLAPVEPITAAEAVISDMPNAPTIRYGGDLAFYQPNIDVVQLPKREQFVSADAFYATAFHELGHSTGHKSRLDRFGENPDQSAFGSASYSREELVAEFAAAFLCGETGITPAIIENAAAYIANWRARLIEDPRAVIVAAGKAQKAADCILGTAEANEASEAA